MAQFAQQEVTIKVSKIVRDSDDIPELISDEVVANLEAVLEELVNDPKAMVEIIKDEE